MKTVNNVHAFVKALHKESRLAQNAMNTSALLSYHVPDRLKGGGAHIATC